MQSLASKLGFWEHAEYVAEAFVIIGCIGELVADLASGLDERAQKMLERWSTTVLIVALVISLIALVRTNILSGSVIEALGETARTAAGNASKAVTDSGTAILQSSKAKAAADAVAAETDNLSNKSDALNARIDSASRRLAKTEARLAWRHIDPQKRNVYIARLKPFAGSSVGFDFSASSGDQEAIGFAKEVLGMLQEAGWTVTDLHNWFGTTTGLECRIPINSPSGKALESVMNELPDTTVSPLRGSGSARLIFGSKTVP
jgi:hypothetical protein